MTPSRHAQRTLALLLATTLMACGRSTIVGASSPGSVPTDSGAVLADAGLGDAGPRDAGRIDAGPGDAGPGDAGPGDAGPGDGGRIDAGTGDAGPSDAGRVDGGNDAGTLDAGPTDAGTLDAGPTDTDAGPADAGQLDAGPVVLDLSYELFLSSHDNDALLQYSVAADAGLIQARALVAPHANVALSWPHGVAVVDDSVVVSSSRLNQLLRVPLDGGSITTFGTGVGLNRPIGVALAADGSLYVTSLFNHALMRFSQAGQFLGVIGATGPGTLNLPGGLIASDGELLVSNEMPGRVVRYSPGDGGLSPLAFGPLTNPGGLAVLADGGLLVGDQSTNRVLLYDRRAGTFKGALVNSGSGGLAHPLGLALTPSGELLVASYASSQILRYDSRDGGFLGELVGPLSPGPLMGPTWLFVRSRAR